eukprot:611318-Pleurochrysis_carterae.AAC.1
MLCHWVNGGNSPGCRGVLKAVDQQPPARKFPALDRSKLLVAQRTMNAGPARRSNNFSSLLQMPRAVFTCL